MGTEVRKERYDRSIKWLEGVQAGKIVPDLPLATDEETGDTLQGFSFHSEPKLNNNW